MKEETAAMLRGKITEILAEETEAFEKVEDIMRAIEELAVDEIE